MWLVFDALAFGGAIVSTIAAGIQEKRVIGNLRARTDLADRLLAQSHSAEKLSTLAKGLHRNPIDPDKMERAKKILERHLQDLSPEHRQYVLEALAQTSLR